MSDIRMSDSELLKYAIDSGIIDTALLQEKIEMQKREELLKKHSYNIWQGKDGKWRTYLPDEEKGRKLVKKSSETDVENTVVEYWKSQEENPTLKELFSLYNNSRLENRQISEASHLRYTQEFNRYYKSLADRKIKSITADELCDFMERRVSELSMTSKAFSGFKTLTKGIFKRAYRKNYIGFRIQEEVLDVIDLSDKKFCKIHKGDYKEVFSEVEFQEYIKLLEDNLDIWNMALLLILVTGLRGGEAVALKREDVKCDESNYYIEVHCTETRYKKDDAYVYEIKDTPKTEAGIREVIVPQKYNWLCIELLNRTSIGNYIFTNPQKGNRLTTNSLRRRQERNCKRMNIYQKSPHKNRKTYGSILMDSNIDSNLIVQQMGHVDISTTEEYYHRNMKSIGKKASIINCIPLFGGESAKSNQG